jgi:MinD-like ATPase involved in chromosome partitioning or flagellar assembly
VTTNNDTPQPPGQEAPDEARAGWPDAAVGTARHEDARYEFAEEGDAEPYISPGPNPFSSVYPAGGHPFQQQHAPQPAPGWDDWEGWDDRAAPEAAHHEPGHPRVPGYAPAPRTEAPAPGYSQQHPRYPAPLPPLEPLPEPAAETPPWPPAPPVPPPSPAPVMTPPPGLTGHSWHSGIREDEPAPPEVEQPRPTSDSLTSELLLHGRRAAPGSGWRKSIYRATGGLLRFGESAADMRRRDLVNRVRTPVAGGHHRIAVLSLKGGVGKTTTVVGLGATLATLRGDRVIAVDANPDRGTLSDKVRLETAATVRDLLNERDQVRRYADVRAFTSQAPSRLEVLASDRDPGVSVAFGADDYCDAARMLEHFYSICITDCGTGLLHSAMAGVLRLADQIVVVSSPSVDGARSASATLDWLEAHNCGDLVRNAVVVLSAIRPKSKSTVDLDRLEHHFAARCRAVIRIPYDAHLEEGAEVELELLNSDTADAYLGLAATVGDGLAWPRRLTPRPALP